MKYTDENTLIEKPSEMSLTNDADYVVKRNVEIYKRKMGLKNENDTTRTYKPDTFRELSEEYGISVTWLQNIVKTERMKHK